LGSDQENTFSYCTRFSQGPDSLGSQEALACSSCSPLQPTSHFSFHFFQKGWGEETQGQQHNLNTVHYERNFAPKTQYPIIKLLSSKIQMLFLHLFPRMVAFGPKSLLVFGYAEY
jgi:hypothetical protein